MYIAILEQLFIANGTGASLQRLGDLLSVILLSDSHDPEKRADCENCVSNKCQGELLGPFTGICRKEQRSLQSALAACRQPGGSD